MQGADSVIMQNLSSVSHHGLEPDRLNSPCSPQSFDLTNPRGLNGSFQGVHHAEEDFDMPEEVEDIIGHLLTSLKDKVERMEFFISSKPTLQMGPVLLCIAFLKCLFTKFHRIQLCGGRQQKALEG